MTSESTKRQINHKVMRLIVGAIALLLSPVVWVLSGSEYGLTSISISYWTDSRDVFVGALIAIGFFLSAYNGAGDRRDLEFWLSKAACVFAICVALFPTEGFTDMDIPTDWVLAVTGSVGLLPESVHYGTAVLLFVCLIGLIFFFYRRALSKGRLERAYFYLGVGILMVAGIVCLYVVGRAFDLEDSIFWIEVWGLTLFGLGWLRAGSYRNGKPA